MGGWSETDNRAISVQLNLTGTATGTELGNMKKKVCSGASTTFKPLRYYPRIDLYHNKSDN